MDGRWGCRWPFAYTIRNVRQIIPIGWSYNFITPNEIARLSINVNQIYFHNSQNFMMIIRMKKVEHLPICSVPLNTYNLQFLVGFLASAGSLYLTTTPLTVLVSLARRPELLKFGFSGSTSGWSGPYTRFYELCLMQRSRTHLFLDIIVIPLPILSSLTNPLLLTIGSFPISSTRASIRPAVIPITTTVISCILFPFPDLIAIAPSNVLWFGWPAWIWSVRRTTAVVAWAVAVASWGARVISPSAVWRSWHLFCIVD